MFVIYGALRAPDKRCFDWGLFLRGCFGLEEVKIGCLAKKKGEKEAERIKIYLLFQRDEKT